MNYNKLNNLTGWLVFLIATIVYFLTIEDTVSLWDCGEYITAANKLEVGHPPGAPLFMVLGRLFSFFAEPDMVAVWINRLSALSSSFTILFLYWSITMFGKKIMQRKERNWSKGDQIATIGAGVVGALAYTFSDSFWFSAVEGEVYAMSSLFTAAIFWMILKWDAEMIGIKHGEIKDGRSPMRWMILIWFMFGLAIGVHLLGLLAVPAIAYVIYFNLWEKTNLKGIILTGLISVVVLAFVQEGIIPGSVALASSFEVAFVNSFGLPFFSGTFFFFILLIAGFIWGFRYAKRKAKPILNTALWSLAFLLIGYGSFAVIVIRSNANTPLDENDPENLVTLHAYLKREQYGSWPILNGNYWNSTPDQENYGDASPFYLRRFVVENDQTGMDAKAFINEKEATDWAKSKGRNYSVKEKYFSSNESVRLKSKQVFKQTTFLPRMYYTSNNPNDPKIVAYKNWSGYDATDVTDADELGTDGLRLPRFGENMNYMFRYQMNWMYWRYFMWNFSGRQNDFQGHGDEMRGNWISGFSFIDDARLGNQEHAPYYTLENPAHNNFWMLPLVLGVIGIIFHFYRAPKDAFIVFLTFFFTGIAIVIYLNQKPFEPRERDYAYAASFYAFAFWIGLSVLALYDAYKNFNKVDWKNMLIGYGSITAFILIFAIAGGGFILTTWLVIALIGLSLLGLAYGLRKALPNQTIAASLFTILTLFVPYIMGEQGWDDHDRSEKTSAHDLAYNYLKSCAANGIIFSVGDNDTFPLWYLQEVEGVSTDVRVCNTSLFDTDWYTNQMKMKMYNSEPLPITFREDQILQWAGGTDQAFFMSTTQMLNQGINRETLEKLFNMKLKNSPREFNQSFTNFANTASSVLSTVKAKDPSYEPRIAEIRQLFANASADSASIDLVESMENGVLEIFEGYRNQLLEADVKGLEALQEIMGSWEEAWSFLPIKDVISFMQDDDNMIKYGTAYLRVIPTTGFILPVNKKNALASKIISPEELENCEDEIRFRFNSRSVQAITKSDIMILDMLANNDWKRPMYFTSPGNTEVSTAMYQSGHLRTNGMAWEITPILAQGKTPINEKLMFKHLMETYQYGKMNDPNVLTDYYARRQTVQFRTMFAQLAEHYVIEAEQMEMGKEQYGPMIKNLRASGQGKTADSLENSFTKGSMGMTPAELRKKAALVIHKSLEVMPAEVVLDYGERPSPAGGIKDANGAEYAQYQDGVLQDYVGLLYRANDKEGAEKLGAEVARQLESIMGYFKYSPANFAASNDADYIAAVINYATLHKFAGDPRIGNPNGALVNRTTKGLEELYNVDLTRIYSELDQLSMENGESRTDGNYASKKATLQGTMNAIDFTFELTGTQRPSAPQPAPTGMPAGDQAVLNEDVLNNVAASDSESMIQ